jgi:hypothetical protein
MKRIELATAAGRLVAAVPAAGPPTSQGGRVRLVFRRDSLHLLEGP